MTIILEGSDLSGKSTAAKMLGPILGEGVQDRLMTMTEAITKTGYDIKTIKEAIKSVSKCLVIIIVIMDRDILRKRLASRPNPDQYDMDCLLYNEQYISVAQQVQDMPNVRVVVGDRMDKYEKCGRIMEEYLRYRDGLSTEKQ